MAEVAWVKRPKDWSEEEGKNKMGKNVVVLSLHHFHKETMSADGYMSGVPDYCTGITAGRPERLR